MTLRKIIGGGWCAALFAGFIILCNSCVPTPKPPVVTPVPPAVVDQDACLAACDNLNRLNCEDGKDIETKTKCLINAECGVGQTCSAKGLCIAPCVTFCRDTEEQGVWLDPNCVAEITACDQVDNCPLATPKVSSGGGPNGKRLAGVGKRTCTNESCHVEF